jgi:PAS domain-containing protein
MEDIIMCPFVFRTQDAVLCGALAECVMPGMLRGHFSSRNKLASVEMIYDAMGFMQQLERASGSELMAQIIPGSLEMALSPGSPECRVITLAEPPFRIVNVNETWTKLTKYTQMEVEGVELFSLLDPPPTEDQPSNPPFDLDDVMEGRCKCATRLHCDKDGREFVDFISSYPLTKYVFNDLSMLLFVILYSLELHSNNASLHFFPFSMWRFTHPPTVPMMKSLTFFTSAKSCHLWKSRTRIKNPPPPWMKRMTRKLTCYNKFTVIRIQYCYPLYVNTVQRILG